MAVDASEARGQTALSVVCDASLMDRDNRYEIAQLLLSLGANPNHIEVEGGMALAISMDTYDEEEDQSEYTPMFRALTSCFPNMDLIPLLLEHGRDPAIGRDEYGRTGPRILEVEGNEEILRLLNQYR